MLLQHMWLPLLTSLALFVPRRLSVAASAHPPSVPQGQACEGTQPLGAEGRERGSSNLRVGGLRLPADGALGEVKLNRHSRRPALLPTKTLLNKVLFII